MNRLIIAAGIVGALAQPGPQRSTAPGGPGAKATWTNGNKQGVGTATAPISKVWFTLGDGVLTEVYYPTVDKANLRLLEFIVTDGARFFERESVDTDHRVEPIARDVLARAATESCARRSPIQRTRRSWSGCISNQRARRSSCTSMPIPRSTTAGCTTRPTSPATRSYPRKATCSWRSRARRDSARRPAGSST